MYNALVKRIVFLLIPFLLTSCLPQISIKSQAGDEADIFFSTGFSQSTAKTLKAMSGLDSNSPLFNKDDILLLLKNSGIINTSASVPSGTEVAVTGTIQNISKNPLAQTGILSKSEHSLKLTIGPKQISAFYELLNEDAKSYLDLMMIPALIGEKMTVSEYKELLSSMYGLSFAEEIISGTLSINLSSKNGKSTSKNTISLGELLTSTEEKIWEISN